MVTSWFQVPILKGIGIYKFRQSVVRLINLKRGLNDSQNKLLINKTVGTIR